MKHAAEGEPRCSDTSCASEQNRSDKCTRRPPLPEGYFSVPPATVDQLNRLILDGRHPETETGPVANFRVARITDQNLAQAWLHGCERKRQITTAALEWRPRT
jgi:hypothetical protein